MGELNAVEEGGWMLNQQQFNCDLNPFCRKVPFAS